MKMDAWKVSHVFETPITSVSNIFSCIVEYLEAELVFLSADWLT